MRQYFLLAFIGISALLVGCGGGGGKVDVCPEQKLTINSNAPLGQNGVLKLSVFGVSEPKSYTWEGPNGWSSHEKEPEIPNPPKGNPEYKLVIVTNGGCTYTATTGSSLTVTGPWNPCGLDSNVLKINQYTTASFNERQGRVDGSNYLIEATNGQTVADFQFAGNQPPAEGQYTIETGTGAIVGKKARVTLSLQSLQYPITATEGTVYIAIEGTTTIVSFCNVKVVSNNPDLPTTTIGANVRWTPPI